MFTVNVHGTTGDRTDHTLRIQPTEGAGWGQGSGGPGASTADRCPTLLPLKFNSGLKQYPSIDIMKDCKWLTLTVALN